MTTRVLLADDQRLLREGLRRILDECDDVRVVAEASDGAEAVRLAGETRPDVVLIEPAMPGLAGLRAIQRIREVSEGTRCIVLSAQEGRGCVEDALRAGAAGYVLKSASCDELLAAVDAVGAGRFYLSPSITQQVVDVVTRPQPAPTSRISLLTRREREVLALIAEGLSSKEIAAELGVSPKTAETHRASLMEKVGIHKSSSLVRFAIREGLVTP